MNLVSRRWLVNLALVLLIAGLALAGMHFDPGAEQASATRISALQPAEVDRIGIDTAATQIRLQRDSHGWRIVAPIDWPAQTANVKRLLSILEIDAEPVARSGDVDLQSLGLQPPVASLRFNDSPLWFGATNNVGERRYVMTGTNLYLLPDVHLAFASQGLPGLVNRRLLPGSADISALRLPEIEILRDADGEWRSQPDSGIDAAQLEARANDWRNATATRIQSSDPNASPIGSIEVRFADDSVLQLQLISTSPELVIANPGIGLQFHLRGGDYARLIAPPGTE